METYFFPSASKKKEKDKRVRKSLVNNTFNSISSVKDKSQICKAFSKISTFEGRKELLEKIYERSQEIQENEFMYKIECYTPYIMSFKDKLQKKVEIKRLLLDHAGSFDYCRNSYVAQNNNKILENNEDDNFKKDPKVLKRSKKHSFRSFDNSETNSENESKKSLMSPRILKAFHKCFTPNKIFAKENKHRKSSSTNSQNKIDVPLTIKARKSSTSSVLKPNLQIKYLPKFESYLLKAFNKRVIPKKILESDLSTTSKFKLSEERIKNYLKKTSPMIKKSFSMALPTTEKVKNTSIILHKRRTPVLFSLPYKTERIRNISDTKIEEYNDQEDDSFASFSEVKLDNLYKSKIEIDKYLKMLEGIRDTWGIMNAEKLNQLISKRNKENQSIIEYYFL